MPGEEVGMLATLVRERSGPAASDLTHAGSLLGDCVRDDAGQTLFHSVMHARTHWPLGEHVVRGGQAVIPGTGFLEIARAALAHRFEDRPIEIRDLVFLQPFAVGPDETRAMNIRLNREGDHSLVVYGDSEEQPYATARVAYVDSPAGPRQSVSTIRARCRERGEVMNGRLVQNFMDFGPRWSNVQAIHLGQGEALIDLALPAAFGSDLATYALHPALLDMATGAAQKLIPGFAGKDDFYVPFSYGRVLVTRPVPATFSSHVRLRAAEGKSAIFDVTLLDEEGNELVSIERFIMRRVEAFAAIPASSKPARPDGPETAEEGFLREGMTNAEGLEALDRILACNVSPQVAASTLDLDLWLDRLDHGGRGTPAEDANWSIGTPGLVRPGGDAGVRAPRDAIERDLAAIWKEMLGVQQVSIDDDFFELGGQSLIAMRLFNRIRKEHGVELPLSVLFQAPTIAATAALLREAKGLAAIDPSADAADVCHASERRRSALGGVHVGNRRSCGQRTSHRSERTIIKRSGGSPIVWSRSHGAAIDRRCSASMAPVATCSTSATSRGVCTMTSHSLRCRPVAWMARLNCIARSRRWLGLMSRKSVRCGLTAPIFWPAIQAEASSLSRWRNN